jgi:hypothetical protein
MKDFDLDTILQGNSPPNPEEMAGFASDALIGEAIVLSHLSTDAESKLLTIGTLLALETMSDEDTAFVKANFDALAAIAKQVAYLITGTVISQEWH